jgi:hypothetical protein
MITRWEDLNLPFIQELASSGILSDMVTNVVQRGMAPEAAAENAQQRAEQLIEALGYRKW